MKTDSFFHELFQLDPQSLIQLLKLKLKGQYAFESITVKTTERRFDGFFKRVDGAGPHLFVEVQGYLNTKIYWKFYREICTFYEQRDDQCPFIAVVLFLDEAFDPGPFGITCMPPCQLIRANLVDCLKALDRPAGTLTVLKPFALEKKEELPEVIPQWKTDITAIDFPEEKKKRLIELLEYALIQRFSELTEEEVNAMLRLTPLDETVAGKQIHQRGIDKGIDRGKLIGEILMAQRILRQPITPEKYLASKSPKELKAILKQLEAELDAFLKTQ